MYILLDQVLYMEPCTRYMYVSTPACMPCSRHGDRKSSRLATVMLLVACGVASTTGVITSSTYIMCFGLCWLLWVHLGHTNMSGPR